MLEGKNDVEGEMEDEECVFPAQLIGEG